MKRLLSFGVRVAALAGIVALTLSNSHVRAAAQLQSGIDLSALDRTCKPCQDFFQFANGNWIKHNPIPAAYPAWGTFSVLAQHNQDVLHSILESAAKTTAKRGSNEQKIGDFYASCMNAPAIDAAGVKPIAGDLQLASSAAPATIGSTLAALRRDGVDAFFRYGGQPDFKNSTQTIAVVGQGGLGLPDRDYYLKDDAKSAAVRTAYQRHVETMFRLLGDSADAAADEAAAVVRIETQLAQNSMSRVARRDPNNIYHKMTFAQAEAIAPNLQLGTVFKDSRISTAVPVNVAQPDFVKALNAQIAALSPADLHAYLRWHVVHAFASALPTAFADENFNFYSKTLQGTTQQLDRWKRCADATDGALGEALGQVYVARTFPPSAKAQALAMVKNIKGELRDDLSTLSWMSPQTRAKAVAKLDAFLLKIGYPDKWRSYAGLTIVPGPYAQNVIASNRFDADYENAKIGKPVDRSEWGMTPPTVNAYYNPTINEIVFPAGILQPPFFNKDADMAVNYGAIGAVVGHESTHGFDDSGRQFDAQGNLTDWWTPEDAARFKSRAQCVVDQWNQLQPLAGVHENGQLVEGEEIADLGGLTIAYKAFEKWQAHHPRRIIDGFTPEQRFFIGFAHVWAGSERPEYIRLLAQTDVHGYDKFRVNQTLSDMPQFAQAFFCKLNDPMVRPKPQQCQIW
jgi:putative endopeptidase